MWPWEHLLFGYALYSGYTRLRHGRPPRRWPVVALAVATQVPDVDKPLAWTLAAVPAGRSLGHSLFTAAVVIALAVAVSRRWDSPEVGTAVAVGYLSHLVSDVVYPVAFGESPTFAYLLWPVTTPPSDDAAGLYVETARLFTEFVTYLGTPTGVAYLAAEFALVGGVIVLWIADGCPGLRALY